MGKSGWDFLEGGILLESGIEVSYMGCDSASRSSQGMQNAISRKPACRVTGLRAGRQGRSDAKGTRKKFLKGAVRAVQCVEWGFAGRKNRRCITQRPARTERKGINIKMVFVGTFGRAQGLPAELARGRQARKKCK